MAFQAGRGASGEGGAISGEGRADDLGRRTAQFERAVALDQPAALEKRRKERPVGDGEEEGADPFGQGDGVEVRHRQGAEQPSDRDARQEEGAGHVGRDQDRPSRPAVDDRPGVKSDDQRRHRDVGAGLDGVTVGVVVAPLRQPTAQRAEPGKADG